MVFITIPYSLLHVFKSCENVGTIKNKGNESILFLNTTITYTNSLRISEIMGTFKVIRKVECHPFLRSKWKEDIFALKDTV